MTDTLIHIPETTLPGGRVVPAFRLGAYLCSLGPDGRAQINADGTPWVRIDYHEARAACEAIGGSLITESQALALALHLAAQPGNWTEGAVGEGDLRQGLRKGSVRSVQPGTYEPADPDERRWHVTADGTRIYDTAGNALTWVFDDIQGDDEGLVARPFAEDSPSIITAPYPSMTRGMGWRPSAGSDGSGYALVRGGYWSDDAYAGVFGLGDDWPDLRYGHVGFRCTFGL